MISEKTDKIDLSPVDFIGNLPLKDRLYDDETKEPLDWQDNNVYEALDGYEYALADGKWFKENEELADSKVVDDNDIVVYDQQNPDEPFYVGQDMKEAVATIQDLMPFTDDDQDWDREWNINEWNKDIDKYNLTKEYKYLYAQFRTELGNLNENGLNNDLKTIQYDSLQLKQPLLVTNLAEITDQQKLSDVDWDKKAKVLIEYNPTEEMLSYSYEPSEENLEVEEQHDELSLKNIVSELRNKDTYVEFRDELEDRSHVTFNRVAGLDDGTEKDDKDNNNSVNQQYQNYLRQNGGLEL